MRLGIDIDVVYVEPFNCETILNRGYAGSHGWGVCKGGALEHGFGLEVITDGGK